MRYVVYLFWSVVVLLGIFFSALNSTVITVNYYFSKINIYLPLLLVFLLLAGAALGILALLPALIKAKTGNHKLKQRIKQAEQEIKNLRTIPIKDVH